MEQYPLSAEDCRGRLVLFGFVTGCAFRSGEPSGVHAGTLGVHARIRVSVL